jgi:hypothetical protein
VKKLQDSGVECSEMSEEVFTAKGKVVSLPSVVVLFKVLTKRFVKSDASEFKII